MLDRLHNNVEVFILNKSTLRRSDTVAGFYVLSGGDRTVATTSKYLHAKPNDSNSLYLAS